MRTYKVARMTTGGCTEKNMDSGSTEEETDDKSDTEISLNTQESDSELDEEIVENPRKRLRSFDSKNRSDSALKMKWGHSSGPTGKSNMSCNEPSSWNARISQTKRQIDMLWEQLQVDYDESVTTITKQKDAELEQKNAELERKNAELEQKNAELEQKDTELRRKDVELMQKETEMAARFQRLEKENSNCKIFLRESSAFLDCVTDATKKMNTESTSGSATIRKFLSNCDKT